MDDGSVVAVRIAVDRGAREAHGRLHRHLAAARRQLQRAARRSCTAAVLYVFRTLVDADDPAQRRLPRAARTSSSRRARCSIRSPPAAVAARQRGDLPGDHRCAVRRARRAAPASQGTMNNLTFGDDALSVLRDDLRRRRSRRPASTAAAPSTAHDQLAPHRPRGARVALSGARRGVRACAAAAAGRARAAAATASCADCASWSR